MRHKMRGLHEQPYTEMVKSGTIASDKKLFSFLRV